MTAPTRIVRSLIVAGSCLLASTIATDSSLAGGLTLAHPYPIDSAIGTWAQNFAHCIEVKFGIYVEAYGEGKLGSADTLPHAVATGQIEMAILPVAWMAETWPAMAVLAAPGVITGPEQVMRLLEDRQLMQDMDALGAERSGFHIVGLGWQYGAFVGSEAALNDITGKKVRGYGESWSDLITGLGGSAMTIPAYQVPEALQYGAVDGALISVDQAIAMSNLGDIQALAWSDDFTPVMNSVAIVMSTDAIRSWGEKLLYGIRNECSDVTMEFNRNSVHEATTAIASVANSGVLVRSFDRNTRFKWRTAMEVTLGNTSERLGAQRLAARLHDAIQ